MYRLNTKIRSTMLCLSGFELYSRRVLLSDESRGRREIYSVWLLFFNEDAKISIKSSSMKIVHSAEVMCHRQKFRGLGRKDKKGAKQTSFASKATSVPPCN